MILPEVYFPFLFYLAFLNGAVSNIFNHVEPLIRFFTANRFLKLELYLYYKFTVSICLSSERRRARAGVMPRIAFLVCMKQNMISVACSFFYGS